MSWKLQAACAIRSPWERTVVFVPSHFPVPAAPAHLVGKHLGIQIQPLASVKNLIDLLGQGNPGGTSPDFKVIYFK